MDSPSDTYARLAAKFDHTFTDVRGGVSLDYITGEQVTSRLNEVLGPGAWSFKVLKHDIHPEADEFWALGELSADIDGKTVIHQQFGSQKINRSRSTSKPLDIGFDLKGASTDAMKKCASHIGVGLYLSKKQPQQQATRSGQQAQSQTTRPARPAAGVPLRQYPARPEPTPIPRLAAVIVCSAVPCTNVLLETSRADGSKRSPATLAQEGRDRFGAVLCATHFRGRSAAAMENPSQSATAS